MPELHFNHLNKVLSICALSICFIVSGCYQDIKEQLDTLNDRLTLLESICEEHNKSIGSLKTIVDALANNDFVTAVEPIRKGDETLGYRITFSKSGSIDIFHGKNGAPGQNGQNGYTPDISIRKDIDGNYYWTLDGEWLLHNGQKVRANGIDGQDGKPGQDGTQGQNGTTPKLKIQDGMWYVSYDNGNTWEPEALGPATGTDGKPGQDGTQGQSGNSTFSKITYDDNFVYLTLTDGITVLTLPRHKNETVPISVTLGKITSETASFSGHIQATNAQLHYIRIIIRYGTPDKFSAVDETQPCIVIDRKDLNKDNSFSATITGLTPCSEYKYCIILQHKNEMQYGDIRSFKTTDKSNEGGSTPTPPLTNCTAWIYGLSNIPNHTTWKIIDTYGYTRFGLKWDSSYGWFDCNKSDPNGDKDSKLCWAAAAANMIHWWLKVNADNISRYGRYSGPSGYRTSTDEGIFSFFKTAFYNNGNPVQHGLNWFFSGLNRFSGDFNIPQNGVTAGFFSEVTGPNADICEYYEYPSADFFTGKVKDALNNRKCISLVHNYAGIPHAINMWGADFDIEGNITHIYITDNNDIDLENNKAPMTPAGMIRRQVKAIKGKMCMANWQGECNIEIQAITLLGVLSDKWNAYFNTCSRT